MTKTSKKTRIAALFSAICMVAALFAIPAYAADISTVRHSVVCLEVGVENDAGDWFSLSGGSGFFIGERNKNPEYLVTNNHVIEQYIDGGRGERLALAVDDDGSVRVLEDGVIGRMRIKVFFDSTTFIQASLVDTDSVKDVAILRLDEPTSLRSALPVEIPQDNIAGKSVYAVGYPDISENAFYNPTSALGEKDSTITSGAVSRLTNVRGSGVKVVQTDTNIAAGNSGGPLVNDDGCAVGICCGTVTFWNAQGVASDVFYAINISELTAIADRNNIPYATGTAKEGIPLWVFLAGGGGLLLIVIIILIIALTAGSRKKKQAAAAAAAIPAPMPMPMPQQQAPVNMMNIGSQPQLRPGDTGLRVEGLAGAMAGKRVMVKLAGSIVIGRDPSQCNVAVPDNTPGVSSKHCEIWLENGTLYIKDLGSSHGTFISPGMRLDSHVPAPLKEGTIFWLGTENQKFIISMKR